MQKFCDFFLTRYLLITLEDVILKNTNPDSVATAFARSVFPVPKYEEKRIEMRNNIRRNKGRGTKLLDKNENYLTLSIETREIKI